jgi:hypothetical protein
MPVPQPPPWPPEHGFPTRQSALPGYGEPYGEPDFEPHEPKRKGLKILGGVLTLILLAVLAAVVKNGAGGLLGAGGSDPTVHPTATVPSGVSATSSASASLTGPFAGTPAVQFPEGDTGIILPAATAVPGFTDAQVAAGLQQVKRALVAARLDPAMLVSHDSAPLLRLLSPQAGKEIKPYFDKADFFGFATQVAPDHALTSDKVRVTGQITFRGSTEGGIRLLQVVTNFVWVYPFAGTLEESGDHLVIVHDQVTWAIPVDSDVTKDYRGLRLSSWDAFASNMDCDLLKKSLLALGKPQLVTAGTANKDNSAFDPSRSLDVTNTC